MPAKNHMPGRSERRAANTPVDGKVGGRHSAKAAKRIDGLEGRNRGRSTPAPTEGIPSPAQTRKSR